MAHDTNRLDQLGTNRAHHQAEIDAERAELHAEIRAAAVAGIGTVQIARLAHMTRDAVRQIINKAKEADRG